MTKQKRDGGRATDPLLNEARLRYEHEGAEVERYESESFWDARYHRRRLRAVTALLVASDLDSRAFADIGCGTGEYLAEARRLGSRLGVGLDLSSSYCVRARKHGAVVQAEASRIPLRSSSIDTLLCSEVLEHLPPAHCDQAITELLRVAKTRAVITTPNRRALIRLVGLLFFPKRVKALDLAVGHINLMSRRELRQHLGVLAKRQTINTLHVLPPVIGETLHLPTRAHLLVDKLEGLLARVLPNSGNILVAVVDLGSP